MPGCACLAPAQRTGFSACDSAHLAGISRQDGRQALARPAFIKRPSPPEALAGRRNGLKQIYSHVISDGAEALDYVFCRGKYARRSPGTRPRVILLDLNLPKVSGLEVLRRLKSVIRTRKIPVVILTGSQNSEAIAECRRLGAETYIVNPVVFQSLSQATLQLNLDWALFNPVETNARNVRACFFWPSVFPNVKLSQAREQLDSQAYAG